MSPSEQPIPIWTAQTGRGSVGLPDFTEAKSRALASEFSAVETNDVETFVDDASSYFYRSVGLSRILSAEGSMVGPTSLSPEKRASAGPDDPMGYRKGHPAPLAMDHLLSTVTQ